ncbi:hypothetical protein NHP190002_06460 [Helicobacter ailurogastricus]|uniref:hypothetical protein n=1 Tax=Helicobacter ailurogastricus TaxID=1578720 RepID=UPI00244D930F|nr:hypothetical protein [Helicobacter ailurogastricus]GMB89965.1 hypothetical protein NHP190002_06460 [Helicobacter ailurogastricus]
MANTDKENPKTLQPDLNEMSYREVSKYFDKVRKKEKDLEIKINQAAKKLQDLEQQYKEMSELQSKVVQAMELARQRDNRQDNPRAPK